MISLNPNFRDLLEYLNSAAVRYLVVGGYAVNFHGHHRNTKDLDVWLARDPENAKRVSEALQAFGFAARSVPPAKFLRARYIHTFGRAPFRVDLLLGPAGIEFDPCYERRVEIVLDGIRVPFISLADLRTNKQASGRLQDLADLENLPAKQPTSRKTQPKPRRRPRD